MPLSLEELRDREAIRDVLRVYVRGIDRFDLAAVRACYHADAVDERGPFSGDIDGFLAFLASPNGLPQYVSTCHSITDQFVDVSGDVAISETMATAYHELPDAFVLLGLRYLDRFERRADGFWRIAHRKVTYDWRMSRPLTDADRLPPGYPRGARGPSDLLYEHLRVPWGAGPTSADAPPGR